MPPKRDPQRTQVLRRRTTNIVALVGVLDEETGTFPTTAAVTCTIRALDGTPVLGAIDLPMTYVVGTTRYNTAYHATVSATIDLPDAKYSARIRWVLSNAEREFNIPCTAIDG